MRTPKLKGPERELELRLYRADNERRDMEIHGMRMQIAALEEKLRHALRAKAAYNKAAREKLR